MRVVITPSDDVLRRFDNALGALGSRKAHVALARAVNRVTKTIQSRVIRAIAKQSSIPTAIIRRSIRTRQVRPGYGGDLVGVVSASGQPLSLKVFKPKQNRQGTVAKVWGHRTLFPSAFMGPKPGAVSRRLAGHVFKRTGKARFPIEKLFGPSVPEEMVRGESEKVFYQIAETMLPARVEHEIGRLLPS